MKGLEALERLKPKCEIKGTYVDSEVVKDIEAYNIIEKELKALEIIRNNYVNLSMLKDTNNVEDYNEMVNNYFRSIDCNNIAELGLNELDSEQYDLLKEVLKNEKEN